MRSIQSGEKEHADLSRRSGRGQVRFSQNRRSSSDLTENAERFARIDLDRSRFEKECNYVSDYGLMGYPTIRQMD